MRTKKSSSPRHTPDLNQPKADPVVAPSGASPEVASDETLAKQGITRVSVDHFYTGGFHYTNLVDAIAQAKRAGSIS